MPSWTDHLAAHEYWVLAGAVIAIAARLSADSVCCFLGWRKGQLVLRWQAARISAKALLARLDTGLAVDAV